MEVGNTSTVAEGKRGDVFHHVGRAGATLLKHNLTPGACEQQTEVESQELPTPVVILTTVTRECIHPIENLCLLV